jgi:hypothetical protein
VPHGVNIENTAAFVPLGNGGGFQITG